MFEQLEQYNEIQNTANHFEKEVIKECHITIKELKWYHIVEYLKNTKHVDIDELPEKIENLNSQEYGIYGVTMRDNNDTVILYNQTNTKTRQHFTLMHEVGHYLLHNNQNNPTYTSLVLDNEYSEEDLVLEKEANMMAGILLANKKAIQSLLDDRKPFNYLCKYFGISKPALKIRLFNLFYFQTLEQVIKEEKQIEDLYAYSHKTINNYIYYNYKLTIN